MQWVLAYDGACGRCRALAERVIALGAGRLVARSLRDSEVAAWRERLLGAGGAVGAGALCGGGGGSGPGTDRAAAGA